MGSFTPLVFGTNGGMGNECQRFLKHVADKIAQKDTEPYRMAQDTNLFRTSKIGTRMRERLTNAFSQQDRTLLRPRRHCGHLKFFKGHFQAKYYCIIHDFEFL